MKEIKRDNHEPIVYEVHNYITNMNPPKWIHIEDLCRKIFRIPIQEKVSQTDDSRMRKIINEIKLSHVFHKVIITGPKGVKVAESKEEVKKYRKTEIARLEAAKETIAVLEHRIQHHEFERLPMNGKSLPRYEALVTVTDTGQAAFQL